MNPPSENRHDNLREMPPMQGLSPETREAMLQWEIQALKRELKEIRDTVDGLNKDKEKAMRWGILALGTAVIGMGTWIFNLISSHVGK